ncbi:MAG: hypothetical protein NT002_05260 [candidate division Zixibacteria bacterium]|nr:hypothetical protein [candidate division Zixibacteria bacterium]
MNQQDLRKYFGEMLKKEGYISSDSLAVLGKLIRLTLEYRDRLVEEKNEILTVEETRKGLDAYMAVLKENRLPEGLDEKIGKLVKLWLKEINGKAL